MIGNDWDLVLKDIWESDKFKKLFNKVLSEYDKKEIYPKKEDIFNALKLTSYEDVKVVIVGQDPYHGENQAHGLSFSVCDGVRVPPSLKNIYKELENDLGISVKCSGNLTGWASQGVLLLNSILTVEKDKALSHSGFGWEFLTDHVIEVLNVKDTPIVFVLWGNFAKTKAKLITNSKHLIIMSPHPSPFSAYSGFFGSKPFSKINNFLSNNGLVPIDWSK